MKGADENDTFFEGDHADSGDETTVKDKSSMNGSAKDYDYVAKNLDQVQLDASAEDQQSKVDEVSEAINALAFVPNH